MITAKYVFNSPVFLNTKNNGTIIAAVGIIIENDVIKNRALFFLLLNIQKAYPAIDAIITPHTEDNVETSIEFDNDKPSVHQLLTLTEKVRILTDSAMLCLN